jgi:dethiobiotin synthetase
VTSAAGGSRGAAGYFVTGTDTGVGKTWISLGLMAALQDQGYSVLGMKPVASACEGFPEGLRNEDGLALQQQGSFAVPYELIAPHIAAQLVGEAIEIARVERCFRELAERAQWLIVEGVGGWEVPLDREHTLADLALVLGLPVVLVVAIRLGCLSHALLSARAIQGKGLALAGWVANLIDPGCPHVEDNVIALQERIPVPCLGRVPRLPALDARRIGSLLKLGGTAD